jgi:hypothetical protein
VAQAAGATIDGSGEPTSGTPDLSCPFNYALEQERALTV